MPPFPRLVGVADATLAFVLVFALAGYGIRRTKASDIPAVLTRVVGPLAVLAVASIALLLADSTDVPGILRAVMSRL
ncbi:hypothetical protein [Streptomyces misionensis]|uniref:hypothetical protein n=1 Tax=Streptomyces misionensis TaxID=67331 RepID=UPI0036C7BBF7